MHGTPLRGKRVVVQRYGETNRELQAELENEGAEAIEIVTYRWGLPEDTAPLLRLVDALGDVKNVHRHEPFQGYQGGTQSLRGFVGDA